ncbi:hypothetical protein [Viridibacillus arvi]|uniref:hypothetical protein n=1 Tax=Viridibacillus arvi TaxID=263475 RepID=UPI0034CE1FEF
MVSINDDAIFEEVFGDTKDNVISGLEAIIDDRGTAVEFMRTFRKNIRTMGIDIPEDIC